jgi:hypothetical protein
MDYPLSDKEIKSLLRGPTLVLDYEELNPRLHDINDILDNYHSLFILYLTDTNVGHWTCIFRTVDARDNSIIEFFDPYGISIDYQLNIDGIKGSRPKVAALLSHSVCPVFENTTQVQSTNPEIATCGRHCVLRVLSRSLSNKEYINNLLYLRQKMGMDFDRVVCSIVKVYVDV